jgi:hypothetical protein
MPKNKLNSEQTAQLAKVGNPLQRTLLLQAIEAGMEVPAYAWVPVPADVTDQQEFIQYSIRIQGEFEIKDCADQMRAQATLASLYLCPAVQMGLEMARISRFTPLSQWGIFNPMGPTIAMLGLALVPAFTDSLLVTYFLNPFNAWTTVYGLLPEEVSGNEEKLLAVLQPLFEQNGADGHPLFVCLPHYMSLLAPSSNIDEQMKRLVFLASGRAKIGNLDATCDLLEKFKGDPWGRVTAEAQVATQETEVCSGPTSTQFDRWWSIVTNNEQIEGEIHNMPSAWEGAINFLKDASQGKQVGAMHWDEVHDFMGMILNRPNN